MWQEIKYTNKQESGSVFYYQYDIKFNLKMSEGKNATFETSDGRQHWMQAKAGSNKSNYVLSVF